jgi:AraC-like DNA-binding protein
MNPVLEAIPLGEEKTILGFRYEAMNFDTPWHFHPQHELTYIEHSVGTKFIGDYVGPFEPGELVLLRSNLPHCWKNVKQGHEKSQSIVVQWNRGIFPEIPELAMVFDLLKTASRGIIFDKTESETLLPQIQRLPYLKGHALYIELLNILTHLTGCSYKTLSEASFFNDLPSEFSSRMARIHNFISANYHQKIYLKEVANLINMSEQSLSRFFTKMMGRSFFTFLNQYRINMAVRMLLDSDNSVAEIGYACGYESLPFFHKQFKKHKGNSPLVYRKNYKQVGV